MGDSQRTRLCLLLVVVCCLRCYAAEAQLQLSHQRELQGVDAPAPGGGCCGAGPPPGVAGVPGSGGPRDAVFLSLLRQHGQIQRRVEATDTGIKSLTTSHDPEVAKLIQIHVAQMRALLESCAKGRCSDTPRFQDPLFRAVYMNAAKIGLQATNVDKGVRVVEDGKTEAAKLLVQAHAAVVSNFVKFGLPEYQKTHAVPAAAKAGLNLN